MVLVYIENIELLSKIITYLDYGKINYTTNVNDSFDVLLTSQVNNRALKLINKAKKVIFIAYLEELKIFNNKYKMDNKSMVYNEYMRNLFNNCNIVITSLPYFKKIINVKKTVVIPYENLCIGICKNKLFNLRKKSVAIIDSHYKYLSTYFEIISKNTNYNFDLIGYDIHLNKKDSRLLNDIPKNLTLYKYCNDRLLQNYISNSQLVVFFDNILESEKYLNICLNLKKNILLLNSNLCNDYFIDNKNIYLFSLDSFQKKFNKIISNRVCNLGLDSYNLVKDNTFEKIADKLCKLLK